jgi:hypothetical protein
LAHFFELISAQQFATSPGQWLPMVDLCESPDMIKIRIELSGADIFHLRISLIGNLSKVTGRNLQNRLAYNQFFMYAWSVTTEHFPAGLSSFGQ